MIIGYFTLNFIIIPMLVSELNAERKVWTIDSTAASCNRNEMVTRAVGANFSVTIIAICDSLDDYSCEMRYIFSEDEHGRFSIWKESPINFSGILNIPRDDVKVLYTGIKEQDPTPKIIVNFTIIPPSKNELNMTLRTTTFCRGTLATLMFVGCKNHTEFDVRLSGSGPARYLDQGTIICTKSDQGRAVFNNNGEALQTQCLDDATWIYASNITCLYPIAAELRIDGKPYRKTVDLNFNQSRYASDEVFVQCFQSDRSQATGSIVAILPQHKMEAITNKSIINLHPNFNGANVSCYFENRYTERFDPYQSTSLLNISFGPYPPKGFQSLCYFNNGSIKFYSNPASTESILSLWQGENEKIPATIIECCEMNYGVVGQMITPNMSITGADLKLRGNYSGRIENFNVTPCQSVTTTTQLTGIILETNSDSILTQDVQDVKPEDFTMLVMLIIGSVFLLMTISVIKYLYWTRHNKKKPKTGEDKATVDNEIQRNYPAGMYEEVNAVPTKYVGSHDYMNVVPLTTRNDAIREKTLLTETNGYQTLSFSSNYSTYEYVSNS